MMVAAAVLTPALELAVEPEEHDPARAIVSGERDRTDAGIVADPEPLPADVFTRHRERRDELALESFGRLGE